MRDRMFYAPDAAGETGGGTGSGTGGSGEEGQGDGQGQGLTWDSWINEQPEDVKTLLSGHTKGLKSALDGERDARKDLEKQLRDLAKKAEKGSELETQLNDLVTRSESEQLRADFYEAAHQAGVTNLKLAFLVAQQDELIDRRGRVNFETLKRSYPELFGSVRVPAGNAGAGTGKEASGSQSMNDFIRRAAGRG